jgi:hypothetical protein
MFQTRQCASPTLSTLNVVGVVPVAGGPVLCRLSAVRITTCLRHAYAIRDAVLFLSHVPVLVGHASSGRRTHETSLADCARLNTRLRRAARIRGQGLRRHHEESRIHRRVCRWTCLVREARSSPGLRPLSRVRARQCGCNPVNADRRRRVGSEGDPSAPRSYPGAHVEATTRRPRTPSISHS